MSVLSPYLGHRARNTQVLCIAALLSLISAPLQAAVSSAQGVVPAARHTVNPYDTRQTLPATPRASVGPQTPTLPADFQPAAPADWTYLVYIVGDNNLEEYVSIDLETELASPGSTARVQVVALADRSPDYSADNGNWSDTRLFHVTPGLLATANSALSSWGERNMGDPQTLTEFLSFAKTYYPAEKYALVFWDHGWIWRPGQSMQDETDADTLDQDEIAQALEAAGGVDVVAYDACLMATIEVMATVRPHARAMVASEDYVGYEGFRHEEVLAALNNDPTLDAEGLAIAMAQTMTDRTITAVTLGPAWDQLQVAVDNWAGLLLNGLGKNKRQYEQAWKATKGFADPLTKDLLDAAVKVRDNVSDAAVKSASQAVIDAVEEVVLFEWHRDVYARAYGITIFWPQGPRDLDAPSSPVHDFEYYQGALNFAQDTRWDEFIYAYANR